MTRPLPPALLADATSYGTLAAVRDLGARGVPVILAYDEAVAPARWSRHVQSVVRCPSTKDAKHFLGWLNAFGASNPGCVLCLTSDDVAFLAAAHLDTPASPYRVFCPSLDGLLELLDKSRLAAAAKRAGLRSPATWSPANEDELHRLIPELPLPIVIKPRTHILSHVPGKPVLIRRREDVLAAWRQTRDASTDQARATRIAGIEIPILQACHAVSERVYTVDGFVDGDGKLVAATACVKCLQLPRRSGVGICFESALLDPDVLAGLERLCRDTGFRGVFDAEFLIDSDDLLLIDLNPRFYNHMAFEVERNLPLPWMSYLAAIGDHEGVRNAVAGLDAERAASGRIYVHRFLTASLLASQRATGRMSAAEVSGWRRWSGRGGDVTNPAFVPGDPMPAGAELAYWLRHPRSFLYRAALR
jgi:predicted ATP-grasp superfamily ATP-dependent carboligase